MFFELPPLPYKYNDLEPHIDALTMEIHHNKHHRGYVDNLNKACNEEKIESPTLLNLLKNSKKHKSSIRNNAGGHYNHTMFWKIMSPNGGDQKISKKMLDLITSTFGSFQKFKEEFAKAAQTRFGSGWAWLCIDNKNKLFITSTANQDNPLMDVAEEKGYPILGLDVWEHAYYLKYQNKRPAYIEAFWNVVNWEEVEMRYDSFIKGNPKL